jgi:glycosyltransferase involved in cell wall biosynthesis
VDEETQLWVCPARLEPFKGLDAFLPCLAGVKGVRLLIAGEGSQRAQLESMIAREDLPASLLGQVELSEMLQLYAAADLFVDCS